MTASARDPIEQWWEATRERQLLVQRCHTCGNHQHYPRFICTNCAATAGLEMVPAVGEGRVWSFTVVHRSPSDEVAAPFTVALVKLVEGPVLLTWLEHENPACDEPVHVTWRPLSDGRNLPVFSRAQP